MGDYTTNQRLYLTDPEELINVEQDLNYNLRRADQRVKPLVEYQTTDIPTITGSDLPMDVGFKWYKTYTNSIWAYRDDGLIYQDANAYTDSWVTGFTWATGYGPANTTVDNVAASTRASMVRLRGQIVLNGGASDLPLNTNTDVMELPVSLKPVNPQYFTIYGGNATGTDFQIFRFFIPGAAAGNQNCQFIKYGSTASAASERFLGLNDVVYSLEA